MANTDDSVFLLTATAAPDGGLPLAYPSSSTLRTALVPILSPIAC